MSNDEMAHSDSELTLGGTPGVFDHQIVRRGETSEPCYARPKSYDLYAVCVAGLNRLIPRHLSESRVVYGQVARMPLFNNAR
jgi:hypothetical protein